MQGNLFFDKPDVDTPGLQVVYAQFQRTVPYTADVFAGYTSLRVLTYSASIARVVTMLNQFDSFECVFGYEGVLHDFTSILALQKVVTDGVITAIQGLDNTKKRFILERVGQGQASFYVVKNAIAHAKIYLLEGPDKRRVVVGSANLSEQAFSGRQAETLIVFDDPQAWEHYYREYEAVKQRATSEISDTLLTISHADIQFEDIPIIRDAQQTKGDVVVFVNADPKVVNLPTVIREVERVGASLKNVVQPIVRPKNGQIHINREIVGKIVTLKKNQKRDDTTEEPTWLSIHREAKRVVLVGKEVDLTSPPDAVRLDVGSIIEYYENFQHGFHGDVAQHQRDYFLFMAWFYFAPFVSELRNRAISQPGEYIFDYPLFAVLYGKSNSGKTRLIETLMKSMFGYWQFEDKATFTRTNLQTLRQVRHRFPVVYDDVDKKRFADHASDIIKDESLGPEEAPAFVLSMNAEDHNFPTELRKRCLILYTRASLPDNTEAAKTLYKSVSAIQSRISTALYHTYIQRIMERLDVESFPQDILRFSSETLIAIFHEFSGKTLPAWCTPVSIQDYQKRKYEKIETELLKLYETSPGLWDIRRHDVILRVPQAESFGLRKEIPDWILKEGSKGGNIVLDKARLEEFIGRPVKRQWLSRFKRQ